MHVSRSVRHRASRVAATAFLALASLAASADAPLAGVLRIWGHENPGRRDVTHLVEAWQDGFQRGVPAARFDTRLRGNDTAIGGLYTGVADLAVMERDASAIERDGYEQALARFPSQLVVALGHPDHMGHDGPIAIAVHADNPLAQLSLTQLDAVFGGEHRRGDRNARTWGDLGLTGAWAARPIQAVVPAIPSIASQEFQKVVLKGSGRWSPQLEELAVPAGNADQLPDASAAVAARVAANPGAIGLVTLPLPAASHVKLLALAESDAGPFAAPTQSEVAAGRYPLARRISVFFDQPKGQPVPALLAAYLRYILGPEGQADVARAGYLPLPPALAAAQRAKLP